MQLLSSYLSSCHACQYVAMQVNKQTITSRFVRQGFMEWVGSIWLIGRSKGATFDGTKPKEFRIKRVGEQETERMREGLFFIRVLHCSLDSLLYLQVSPLTSHVALIMKKTIRHRCNSTDSCRKQTCKQSSSSGLRFSSGSCSSARA